MTPTFPGMNPYLENPALWSEVHSWLIVELARYLNPSLVPKYRAAVEKRVYLDALLVGIPDASVFEQKLKNEHKTIATFNPEVIVGGPPCQDFSSAGKRDESLGRADLTLSFANIVSHIKPQWFVMENVERIAKSRMLETALEIFKKIVVFLNIVTGKVPVLQTKTIPISETYPMLLLKKKANDEQF